MTRSGDNPFVMPGMGQSNPDLAANPLLAGMEMMQQAWAGMSGTGGWAQSLPLTAALDPEALDKRIAELKSVESWLSMNLSMLSSAIQGLQVQRATIHTLRSFADAVAQAPQSAEPGQSPLDAVLGIRRPGGAAGVAGGQGATGAAPTSPSPPSTPPPPSPSSASSGSATFSFGTPDDRPGETDSPHPSDRADSHARSEPTARPTGQSNEAGQDASRGPAANQQAFPGGAFQAPAPQAWFDALQSQFNQLAAATLASMPNVAAAGAHAAKATETGEPGPSRERNRPSPSTATAARTKGARTVKTSAAAKTGKVAATAITTASAKRAGTAKSAQSIKTAKTAKTGTTATTATTAKTAAKRANTPGTTRAAQSAKPARAAQPAKKAAAAGATDARSAARQPSPRASRPRRSV